MAIDSTSITVRELYEEKLCSLEKLTRQKFRSMQEALRVADRVLDQWKATQNEWREQSKDRDSTFATKSELEALKLQLARLEKKDSNVDGRWWTAGFMFTAVVALAALYLKKG